MVAASIAVCSLSFTACCCPGSDSSPAKSAAPAAKADSDLQQKRADLIEKYKKERVIHKVEGESLAKLYVMPRFYTLPVDDKKTVANLVYVWFYRYPNPVNADTVNPGDHVEIIDHANGKQVGSYDPITGLSMD
jgi:hypothetical protein